MPSYKQRTAEALQRMGAAVMLVFFAAWLLLPMTNALQHDDDAMLPACCRARGTHHCSAMHLPAGAHNDGPLFAQVTEKCPYAPAITVGMRGGAFEEPVSQFAFANLASPARIFQQAVFPHGILLDPSNPKRGPPNTSS